MGQTNYDLRTNFNPHAREGRDFLEVQITVIGLDFNPHAREGRDSLTTIY